MAMAHAFYVDTRRCYGCKTCSVACAVEHTLHPGVVLRRVRQLEFASPSGMSFVSLACAHCDEPVCAKACPVGAYEKDTQTGLVLQNHTLCIGCRACVDACPFHAPSYDASTATVFKCDGCISRIVSGLPAACVEACPVGALEMGYAAAIMSDHPEAVDIRALVSTSPNLLLAVEPDLDLAHITEIDADPRIVDWGVANPVLD